MTTKTLVLSGSLAGLVFAGGAPGLSSSAPTGRDGAPACVLTRVDSTHVGSEGRSLYVEAQTLGMVHGGLLIVGQPSYEWVVNPGGRLTLAEQARDLGVWLNGETVSRISFPTGVDHVAWVRGAAVAPDRWGFVMQALDAPAGGDPAPGRIVYAEYTFPGVADDESAARAGGGGGWSTVEPVFLPGDRWDSVLPMSTLQQAPGEGLFVWAGLARGQRGLQDVVLFGRKPEGWEPSVLVSDWADVAALHVASAGPWTLAVGGLDPDFGARLTSIRAFAIADGVAGDPVRLDMGEEGDRFRRPVVSGAEDPTPDLAWVRADADGRRRVWLATDVHVPPPPVPMLLDPWGDHVRYGTRRGASNLWLTRRAATLTGDATLRVTQVVNGVPVDVGAIPYPFVGDFEVMRDPGGDLLVVGPTAELSTFTPFVRSLILRLSIDCT